MYDPTLYDPLVVAAHITCKRASAGTAAVEAATQAAAKAEGAFGRAGAWAKEHAVPLAVGVGGGLVGKRVYDDMRYAEESRQQGMLR